MPKAWKPQATIVYQPSQKIHEMELKKLQSFAVSIRDEMKEADALTGGFRGERRRGKQLEDISKYHSDIREGEQFPREFGQILATSGFKVASRGCSLDWGLVLVNQDRSGTNEVCLNSHCNSIVEPIAKISLS